MRLEYKGYIAECGLEDDVIFGRVTNIKSDIISFEAKTASELCKAFHESIDSYLAFCEERGEEPDKPFSGKLVYRPGEERHSRLAEYAAQAGLSLNDILNYAADLLLGGQARRAG